MDLFKKYIDLALWKFFYIENKFIAVKYQTLELIMKGSYHEKWLTILDIKKYLHRKND